MKIKNETEIQLMKILFKTSGKKPTKNVVSQRAYPHGVEMKYYRQLKTYFKPLTDYVNKYINEHLEPLLRGDSKETHLDAIPGDSYRNMIYSLENWLSIYMPDISETPESANNNVIFVGLGKTADEAMEFSEKEFKKIIDKGIHVNVPISAPWWDDMKASWAEDNYTLITSNAKRYVEQINVLTEQAIVNGMSPGKLKDEIFKATQSLSDKHCKLLARDQMGKLNGQITQAQMQEIGLDLYVWSTSYDDRVRDSHAAMEGLLCRWDDATLCSRDNGKTWEPRPAGAVDLHPGQDIQCRCVGLAFYPELESEMEGVPMQDVILESPALSTPAEILGKTPEIINFTQDELIQLNKDFTVALDSIEDPNIRNYVKESIEWPGLGNNSSKDLFVKTMSKLNEPGFVFNTEPKTGYVPSEKIIKLVDQSVFNFKEVPLHEIIHAFSELNKKNGKPLSRDKLFVKAFNDDYAELLKKYGGTEQSLNEQMLKLYKKEKSYLPVIDLIGGKQKQSLLPNMTHNTEYWNSDYMRVYDEEYGTVGGLMFNKKQSKFIKEIFPKSYNIIREDIHNYLKKV